MNSRLAESNVRAPRLFSVSPVVIAVMAALLCLQACSEQPPRSPRVVLGAFRDAMVAGDEAKALAEVDFTDPLQRETVASMVAVADGAKRLVRAGTARWGGETGAFADLRRKMESSLGIAEKEVSEPRIDRDVAVIALEKDAPVRFRRIAGQWKIEGERFTENRSRTEVTSGAQLMREWGDVLRRAATDIDAGKYATPNQVINAMLAELQKVTASHASDSPAIRGAMRDAERAKASRTRLGDSVSRGR